MTSNLSVSVPKFNFNKGGLQSETATYVCCQFLGGLVGVSTYIRMCTALMTSMYDDMLIALIVLATKKTEILRQ